jgi:hypothetical protein
MALPDASVVIPETLVLQVAERAGPLMYGDVAPVPTSVETRLVERSKERTRYASPIRRVRDGPQPRENGFVN